MPDEVTCCTLRSKSVSIFSIDGEGALALSSKVDLPNDVACAVFSADGVLLVSVNERETPIHAFVLADGEVCVQIVEAKIRVNFVAECFHPAASVCFVCLLTCGHSISVQPYLQRADSHESFAFTQYKEDTPNVLKLINDNAIFGGMLILAVTYRYFVILPHNGAAV
jgi:hypothetical protein